MSEPVMITAAELDAQIRQEQQELSIGKAYEDMSPAERIEFDAALNKDLPRTSQEWLQYACKLDPIEYDRQRETIAKKLEIRVSTLDEEVEKHRSIAGGSDDQDSGGILLREPEPWKSTVNGLELINAIRSTFEKYVILPAGAAVALALWVLHTYLLDAADVSPMIGISSPQPRCGKTAVLELLQATVYKPLPASNITAAALFRTVEAHTPTLLIDEAETFIRDNDELRGIINSGHRRASAYVIRTVGDNHESKQFSTWCPKAIALIGKLPGTLQDRSIVIKMRRKSHAEKVERLRYRLLLVETRDLQMKAARWRDDNQNVLRNADPAIPESLNDRAADCWRPLFAIADRIGGNWPELARSASHSLSIDEDSVKVQLLTDIRSIFTEARTDKMFSETLIGELIRMEDRRWPEWKNGKPITKTQLAQLLNDFDVVVKAVRIGPNVQKGYELKQFSDAFFRYLPLPPSQSVTSLQPAPVLDCNASKSVTTENDVTVCNPLQPAPVLDCNDVTVQKGGRTQETTKVSKKERL